MSNLYVQLSDQKPLDHLIGQVFYICIALDIPRPQLKFRTPQFKTDSSARLHPSIKTLKTMGIGTGVLFNAQQIESPSTLVNLDENYMPRALSNEER